uniref:Uncharacterized protein n=1 Tax=Clandestinovirus TaxID=2831644 RepID=A0A8F8PMQ1_9VIRU|nr:hypothetical protein KOM_12_472 [Clandestinovirus]
MDLAALDIENPELYVDELLARTDPSVAQGGTTKKKKGQKGQATGAAPPVVLNYNNVPNDIQQAVDKIKKIQDWKSETAKKEKNAKQGYKAEANRVQDWLAKQGDEALIEYKGYSFRTMVSQAKERLSDEMLLKAYKDLKTDHPEMASAAATYYMYITKRRMKQKKNVKLSIRKTGSDTEAEASNTNMPPPPTIPESKQPPMKKQKLTHHPTMRTPSSSNQPKTPTTGQEVELPDFYNHGSESYSSYYK